MHFSIPIIYLTHPLTLLPSGKVLLSLHAPVSELQLHFVFFFGLLHLLKRSLCPQIYLTKKNSVTCYYFPSLKKIITFEGRQQIWVAFSFSSLELKTSKFGMLGTRHPRLLWYLVLWGMEDLPTMQFSADSQGLGRWNTQQTLCSSLSPLNLAKGSANIGKCGPRSCLIAHFVPINKKEWP